MQIHEEVLEDDKGNKASNWHVDGFFCGTGEEGRQRAALFSNAPDMLEILQTLKRRLPELDDDEAPLAGSEAVEVLCSIWSDLNTTIAKAKGE